MTTFPQRRRRTTLLAGGLFHFYHDGIADGMAVFLPLWQASFGLSLASVGLLVTCYEGITGLFQIPAGFAGERMGERRLLVGGTLVTAVSYVCLGFSGSLVMLVSLLSAGGLGAAVQHPLAASMVSNAYDVSGRRQALGTYNFAGDIGKLLFPVLTAAALSRFHWGRVCTGIGLFGCALTVALFRLLACTGKNGPVEIDRGAAPASKGWGIRNRGAFSLLSIIAVVDTAVRSSLVTFAPFLFIQKGIAAESVGFVLSLLFVGGALGKFACGALAERIGITAAIMATEGITGLGILVLVALPFPHAYFLLPILGAALNGTSSVLYGTVADYVAPDRVTRAFGFFYTLVIVASALSPPLMGGLSDRFGLIGGIRFAAWAALATLPLAVVLSRRAAAP